MNVINPYIINIIGLFLDIIGAILVAWEVAGKFRGKKFYDISPPQCGNWAPRSPETDEFINYTKSKECKMKIGLAFLLVGFSLQIASNLISYHQLPSEERQSVAKASTVKINPNISIKNAASASHGLLSKSAKITSGMPEEKE